MVLIITSHVFIIGDDGLVVSDVGVIQLIGVVFKIMLHAKQISIGVDYRELIRVIANSDLEKMIHDLDAVESKEVATFVLGKVADRGFSVDVGEDY